MTKTPKFTILLPTYNRPDYIQLAISSVLNQDCNDIELVILDDSSNNETTLLLSAYSDPRITYIKNKKNIGYAKNLKQGFLRAIGKYIMILSDDDIVLRTDTLSTIYTEMGKKQAGYAQTGLVYYDLDHYRPSVLDHVATKLIYVPPSADVLIKTLDWHYGFMSGNVFRRDFIDIKNDILDTTIWWPYLKAAYRAMKKHGGIYFGKHFIVARTSTTGLIAFLDVAKNDGFYMDSLFPIYKEFDSSEKRFAIFLKNRLDIVVGTLPGIKYYTSNKNVLAIAKSILQLRPDYAFEWFFWFQLMSACMVPKILLSVMRSVRTISGYVRLQKLIKDIHLKEHLDNVLKPFPSL